MKLAVKIVQLLVGVLFIVSGLVKANDPVGLGYKMQEFFELWSESLGPASFVSKGLAALHDAALAHSVLMITLEILIGVALLLGWRKKLVLTFLLLLIIFFTFLTGYANLSGKFTNCGCFGDCIPITPLTSFLKDCVLLLLIVFLIIGQRWITPILSARGSTVTLLATLLFSLGLQWYVLSYLPIADCLPFKKGSYLPAQMKPPPGAVPDSFAIAFIYEKGGKQFEFSPDNLPADFTTYKFVDRRQKLVRKGNADAPIKGFTLTNASKDSVTGNTIDSAEAMLALPKVVLIFAKDFDDSAWISQARTLVKNAAQNAIPVAIVSANHEAARAAFEKASISGVQFFSTDFTVVRTVARTNPTVLLLHKGSVVQKWGKHELDKAAGAVLSDK